MNCRERIDPYVSVFLIGLGIYVYIEVNETISALIDPTLLSLLHLRGVIENAARAECNTELVTVA